MADDMHKVEWSDVVKPDGGSNGGQDWRPSEKPRRAMGLVDEYGGHRVRRTPR